MQVIERHFGIEEVKGQSLKIISDLVINEVCASIFGGDGQVMWCW